MGGPRGFFAAASLARNRLQRRLSITALPRALTGSHTVAQGLHAIADCEWLCGLMVGGTTFRHAVGMVLQRAPQVRVARVEVVLRCQSPHLATRPRPSIGPPNCTASRKGATNGTRTTLRRPRRGASPTNCGCSNGNANAPIRHRLLQLAGTVTACCRFSPPRTFLVHWIALSAPLSRAIVELAALVG